MKENFDSNNTLSRRDLGRMFRNAWNRAGSGQNSDISEGQMFVNMVGAPIDQFLNRAQQTFESLSSLDLNAQIPRRTIVIGGAFLAEEATIGLIRKSLNPEAVSAQENLLSPSFVEIATPSGQHEVIAFEDFQTRPYWQTISTSVDSAVATFNTIRNNLAEKHDVNINSYRILIPGQQNMDGLLEPTPTPTTGSTENTTTNMFFSYDGGGMLFLPDIEQDNGNWNIFLSDNNSLIAAADEAPQYVVIDGNNLIALAEMNSENPVPVAIGVPSQETSRIRWESASGNTINEENESLNEITYSIAEQIPVQELGEYTSGVRFTFNEKTWEFVSDIPGLTLDAETTNMPIFTDRLFSLVHSTLPAFYESPSTQTVRFEISRDDSVIGSAIISSPSQGWGMDTTIFIEEEGLVLSKIRYNADFFTYVNNEIIATRNPDEAENIINFMIMYQLYFGRRTHNSLGDTEDLFEHFGLNSIGLTVPAFNNIFRGLGVTYNSA